MPFQTENKPDSDLISGNNESSIPYAKYSNAKTAEVKGEGVMKFSEAPSKEREVSC